MYSNGYPKNYPVMFAETYRLEEIAQIDSHVQENYCPSHRDQAKTQLLRGEGAVSIFTQMGNAVVHEFIIGDTGIPCSGGTENCQQ